MERFGFEDYSESNPPLGPGETGSWWDRLSSRRRRPPASRPGSRSAPAWSSSARLIVTRASCGGDASPPERVCALVRELDLRIRRTGRRLAQELERTEEDSLRSAFLGELAWTIELEQVMPAHARRCRGDRGRRRGADHRARRDGEPVTEAFGLSDGRSRSLRSTAHRERTCPVDDDLLPHSRQAERAARRRRSPRACSAVEARGHTIGVLSVFSRDEFDPSTRRRNSALEELAARAGPALDNARRYLEARRLADLDARTGLHNARYFEETLEREVARARRYRRQLALVVFDLDDFKQINDRFGHLAGTPRWRASPTGSARCSAPPTSPAGTAATSSGSSCRRRDRGGAAVLQRDCASPDHRAADRARRPHQPLLRDRRAREPGGLGDVLQARRRRALPRETRGQRPGRRRRSAASA